MTRISRIAATAATMALLLLVSQTLTAAGTESPPGQLPDGVGRDVTAQICGSCHGVDFFVKKRQTRLMWQLTVEEMIGRGAVGTPEQFEQIVRYLGVHLGERIKINEASPQLIADAMGIPPDQARAIADYRAKNGPFKSAEDIEKVPGLDPARIEEQRPILDFD